MNSDVTTLLQDLPTADEARRKEILDEVVTLLAGELRDQARYRMALEPARHVLQATALVNEFYLKIVQSQLSFGDRKHFLLAAAKIMRNIVVDEARRFRSEKRGGRLEITALDYENVESAMEADPDTILHLNAALARLSAADEHIVELRYFFGLTVEETAQAIGIEYETLRKRWVRVRRHLYKLLTAGDDHDF